MIPKNTNAFLFDMDGTLTNTEPSGIITFKQICNKYALEYDGDDISLFDKVWRRDGTDIEFEDFMHNFISQNHRTDVEKAIVGDFFKVYKENITNASLLPGVSKLLNTLDQSDYKLAVVTASTKDQAMSVIQKHNWENVFDLVLSQDEFKVKKPNPDSYVMAATRLGLKPRECVVVEDSKNGALAGKNAGCFVIDVRAGNEHEQDLSSADLIVSTLDDIIDLLN